MRHVRIGLILILYFSKEALSAHRYPGWKNSLDETLEESLSEGFSIDHLQEGSEDISSNSTGASSSLEDISSNLENGSVSEDTSSNSEDTSMDQESEMSSEDTSSHPADISTDSETKEENNEEALLISSHLGAEEEEEEESSSAIIPSLLQTIQFAMTPMVADFYTAFIFDELSNGDIVMHSGVHALDNAPFEVSEERFLPKAYLVFEESDCTRLPSSGEILARELVTLNNEEDDSQDVFRENELNMADLVDAGNCIAVMAENAETSSSVIDQELLDEDIVEAAQAAALKALALTSNGEGGNEEDDFYFFKNPPSYSVNDDLDRMALIRVLRRQFRERTQKNPQQQQQQQKRRIRRRKKKNNNISSSRQKRAFRSKYSRTGDTLIVKLSKMTLFSGGSILANDESEEEEIGSFQALPDSENASNNDNEHEQSSSNNNNDNDFPFFSNNDNNDNDSNKDNSNNNNNVVSNEPLLPPMISGSSSETTSVSSLFPANSPSSTISSINSGSSSTSTSSLTSFETSNDNDESVNSLSTQVDDNNNNDSGGGGGLFSGFFNGFQMPSLIPNSESENNADSTSGNLIPGFSGFNLFSSDSNDDSNEGSDNFGSIPFFGGGSSDDSDLMISPIDIAITGVVIVFLVIYAFGLAFTPQIGSALADIVTSTVEGFNSGYNAQHSSRDSVVALAGEGQNSAASGFGNNGFTEYDDYGFNAVNNAIDNNEFTGYDHPRQQSGGGSLSNFFYNTFWSPFSGQQGNEGVQDTNVNDEDYFYYYPINNNNNNNQQRAQERSYEGDYYLMDKRIKI